eukprot:PhF_6_TR26366/c1_g1_i1/m.37997
MFMCQCNQLPTPYVQLTIRSALIRGFPVILKSSFPGDATMEAVLEEVYPILEKDGIHRNTLPLSLCTPQGVVISPSQLIHTIPGIQPQGNNDECGSSGHGGSAPVTPTTGQQETNTFSESGSMDGGDFATAQTGNIVYVTVGESVRLMQVVDAPQMLKTYMKLSNLVAVLLEDPGVEAAAIPPEHLLSYSDLRCMHYACYLRDSKRLFEEQPHYIYFKGLVLLLSQKFNESPVLANCWFQGYRTGDVVFYDLIGRERMGDFVSEVYGTNVFYWVQKIYDNYSHSGIVVTSGSCPRLFHGLAHRIKVLNYPLFAIYMPRRRVDFSKVFKGYNTLPNEVQVAVTAIFTSGAHARVVDYNMYVNETPGFWQGIWRLFGWRFGTTTTKPELLTKKVDATNAMTHPLCSGFTAAVVYEVLLEAQTKIREQHPEYHSEMEFLEVMHRDVLNFTPKELHNWNIWMEGLSPHSFEKFVTRDVTESHRFLN